MAERERLSVVILRASDLGASLHSGSTSRTSMRCTSGSPHPVCGYCIHLARSPGVSTHVTQIRTGTSSGSPRDRSGSTRRDERPEGGSRRLASTSGASAARAPSTRRNRQRPPGSSRGEPRALPEEGASSRRPAAASRSPTRTRTVPGARRACESSRRSPRSLRHAALAPEELRKTRRGPDLPDRARGHRRPR